MIGMETKETERNEKKNEVSEIGFVVMDTLSAKLHFSFFETQKEEIESSERQEIMRKNNDKKKSEMRGNICIRSLVINDLKQSY